MSDQSDFQNLIQKVLQMDGINGNLFLLIIGDPGGYKKPTIDLLAWVVMKLSSILVLKNYSGLKWKLFWNHYIKLNVLGWFMSLWQFLKPYNPTSLSSYSYVYIYVETIELWLLKGSHHGWFTYFYFSCGRKTHTHACTHARICTIISKFWLIAKLY